MSVFQSLSRWLVAALCGFTLLACAPQSQQELTVTDGYVRATFPMAKTAAAYFTIHNPSDSPVVVTHVSVDASVANDAQIHTTEMQNDMMQMRHLPDGVTIAPDSQVAFTPGSYHIMLLGLTEGLIEGREVTLTLHIQGQPSMVVTLPVKKQAGQEEHQHHH